MKMFPIVGACIVALLAAPSAQAMTCSIDGVVPVVFGVYDSLSGAPVDSSGSIKFSCSGVGAYDSVLIQLDRGRSASSGYRQLECGASRLIYDLFLDPAMFVAWGDGTGGTSHYGPLTPINGEITVPVYGQIPGGQNVRAGEYSDTVVVTLVF